MQLCMTIYLLYFQTILCHDLIFSSTLLNLYVCNLLICTVYEYTYERISMQCSFTYTESYNFLNHFPSSAYARFARLHCSRREMAFDRCIFHFVRHLIGNDRACESGQQLIMELWCKKAHSYSYLIVSSCLFGFDFSTKNWNSPSESVLENQRKPISIKKYFCEHYIYVDTYVIAGIEHHNFPVGRK